MKKNSIKYSRINGEVQRELSRIISREIKDPRIHPMTSVVSVEVTQLMSSDESDDISCVCGSYTGS